MVHLSSRSPMWSWAMTTHVCTAVELLTRVIREEGDWKIEKRGCVEGGEMEGGGGQAAWEARSECRGEEERCGDVAGRWEVRWGRQGSEKGSEKSEGEVGERWWKGKKWQRMTSGQQKGFNTNLQRFSCGNQSLLRGLCCCLFTSALLEKAEKSGLKYQDGAGGKKYFSGYERLFSVAIFYSVWTVPLD